MTTSDALTHVKNTFSERKNLLATELSTKWSQTHSVRGVADGGGGGRGVLTPALLKTGSVDPQIR